MSTDTAPAGTLATRAMLVDLTIRQWTARKNDRIVARDVARQYGADETMGRYSKDLIGRETLETIHRIATSAAADHRRRTLPWLDSGARILSSAGYFAYTEAMRAHSAEWDGAVATFAANYSTYVDDARHRLNGLFKGDEYPGQITDRFTFGYNVLPVPDASDFRVMLGDAETERIREAIQLTTDAALNTALHDVTDRIVTVVGHMAERLRNYIVTADGASGIFRDSLVENVRSLVEILPTLNLTGNAALTAVTERMRSELCATSADTLRASAAAREHTAAAAEAILKEMGDFVA